MTVRTVENRALGSPHEDSLEKVVKSGDGGGRAALQARSSDPTKLFTLLKGAFSDPSLRWTEGAYEEVVDDYMAFIAAETSAMEEKEGEKQAYGELASLLKSGAVADGKRRTLFFTNDEKTAALWIDDAAKKITIIDVTDEGIASAPQFEELGGDKIRAALARQDRRSQLFREYSNLSDDEIKGIRQFALSPAMKGAGTEQCILKIEHFIGRSAPDMARNFHEEPDLFMKSGKALPELGCDRLKFVSVLSQLLLKNHGVAGDVAKNRRHKMKFLWQLDLLESLFSRGELLERRGGVLLTSEMAIRSVSRTAEELLDKGLLSSKEASSIGEKLGGYRAALEELKRVKGGATEVRRVEAAGRGNSADIGYIDPKLGFFAKDPFAVSGALSFESSQRSGSSSAKEAVNRDYGSVAIVRQRIREYSSGRTPYTLANYLKALGPHLKNLVPEMEESCRESGAIPEEELLERLLEPLFETLSDGKTTRLEKNIEEGYQDFANIIHSLYAVFPSVVPSRVATVATEFKKLVEAGDVAAITTYLDDLLPVVVKMSRGGDGALAVELLMQQLLALPKPSRGGEATIWDSLGEEEGKKLAATIKKWLTAVPVIFMGGGVKRRVAISSFGEFGCGAGESIPLRR